MKKTYATTQKTSKTLKLQSVISSFIAFVGVAWWIFDLMLQTFSMVGATLFAVGIVWRVVVGILIWWHHD